MSSSNNLIELAALIGNVDMVKSLIEEQNYDPKQKCTNGATLLHCACIGGHLDTVKYLIEEHQIDSLSEYDDKTPLHLACGKGHLDIVRYLVDEQSVDPDYASGDRSTSMTPLHTACINGHLEIVKFLIEEQGCDYTRTLLLECGNGIVSSPLLLSCQFGCLPIVKYLVDEQSVDPDYDSGDNCTLTPLHVACIGGHLEVVKFLVEEKGCNYTRTYQNEKGFVMNVLHVASMHGHVDVARYFIEEKQCDPSGNTDNTMTSLSLACQYGYLEMVKYLLNEKSVDLVYELKDGKTPLHLACESGHLEIVKFLIEEKGCDPMYYSAKQTTPYSTACSTGQLDVIRYLTEERHCDPLCKDAKGFHALDFAPLGGNVDILKYFIEERGYNLEVNAKTLVAAIQSGNSEVVQYVSSIGTSNTVTGHSQETSSTPKKPRSSSGQLLPSGESPPPQKKRKKQDTNEVPQQKNPYENVPTPPNIPLPGLSHQLNPGDLAFLMNHLQPISSHWKALGVQLGLLSGELDTIAATPLLIPGGPPAFLQAVLSKWLDRAPPFPTLTKLCDALTSRAVDQSKIALELEQQYPTWKTAERWDEDPELKSLVRKAEPTGRQLGAGAYGSVEQVSIEGEMYAAKKLTMKICMNPIEFYKKFFSEFRILSSLCHPNIVQYQCVCPLPNSESPALVMEQMQTNLHDYLLNPSYANLSLNAKVSILQDVARGLAYLHNHKPAVIHRDLSAKNILLSSDRVAKISDFGNSRIIDIDPACSSEFKSTTHVPGTIIYMPPEACSDRGKFNEKLDIFSFGQLALFTATQVYPSDLLPVYDEDRSCFRTEVERRQKYINQLEQQLGGDHDLIKLIKQCLHNSSRMRPTANEIISVLEQLVYICVQEQFRESLLPQKQQDASEEKKQHPQYVSEVIPPTVPPSGLPHQLNERKALKSGVIKANQLSVPIQFIDPVEIISCDELGCDYYNTRHDVGLRIPKEAILPNEGKIDIEFGVAMYGAFKLADRTSVRRVSPVVWLCVQQDGFRFQKDVEITIPHFLHFATEDAHTHLRFLKADHELEEGEVEYQLKPAHGRAVFDHTKYGRLLTRHFCLVCITTSVLPDKFTRYFLGGGISLNRQDWQIIFYVCYFLQSCLTTVKQQLDQDSKEIYPTEFMFTDGKQLMIKFPSEVSGWLLNVEPFDKMISAEEVDIKDMSVDYLKLKEDNKLYPPRFVVTVIGSSTATDSFVDFTFQGATREIVKRIRLTKAISSPPPPPSVDYPRIGLESVDGTTVLDEGDLQDVRSTVADLAGTWKDLGISLGISWCKLDAIHSHSPRGCLTEMLALWLKQSYNVEKFKKPTWRRLVEAVKDEMGGNNAALAQRIAEEHPNVS